MGDSYTWMGAKIGVVMVVILLLLPVITLLYNAASWIGGALRAFFGLSLTEDLWRLFTYALLIGICAAVGYVVDRAQGK